MLVTNSQNDALCSFGRLPVINGTEIKNYLNKVKSHENYLRTANHTIEEKNGRNASFIYQEVIQVSIHR